MVPHVNVRIMQSEQKSLQETMVGTDYEQLQIQAWTAEQLDYNLLSLPKRQTI